MSILEDINAVVDGAREDSKDVHEKSPSGDLKEESIADCAHLTAFVKKRLRHQVVSVDGECAVVRDEQGRTRSWNLVETL